MTARAEPRLLIYSQDGLGLGHLRRTTLLADGFLRGCPGASALTISDSPLGQFFATRPGHDYLKLPSIHKAAPGDWHPVALASPFDDVLALRRDTIRSAVLRFRPDIVLVDHMPHGAMGELMPTLEALHSECDAHVVLGLRDILDAPEVIRRRWRLEGAFEAIEKHYDEVLIYGSQDVFDVAEQYGWPAGAADRLRYCGYVSAPVALTSAQNPATAGVRASHLNGEPDAALIVAMAGGGADAYELFDTLLEAAPELRAERPTTIVIVTGPFMPAAQREDLVRRAGSGPVHVLAEVSDSLSYLAGADLVVAMAGYNTTAEILRVGTPAVLVPREGPSAEQQIRARLFAERGWVQSLDPAELTAPSLAAAVRTGLAARRRAPLTGPDLTGQATATNRLLMALRPSAARSANGSINGSINGLGAPAAARLVGG